MSRQHTLSLIIAVILPMALSAQLSIDNSQSPGTLVQNILLGGGVTVSNITFNGAPATSANPQVASFNSAGSNVGLASGMVLATGDAQMAVGPNNNGGATADVAANGSDPDLLSIAGTSVLDAAVLEFDFVPTGGQVDFNFVFASEEYIEYVGQYNDAFGFFLSGPGISGPYANNAVNIALVPGTTVPVTINNVNNMAYSSYYIDNGDGWTMPYSSDAYYMQFDGFTTPMAASHTVQCGQTYHIKLAIADANDELLESAVFLEAGAFSSPVASLDLTPDMTADCNEQVQLEVFGVNGGLAPYTYQWSSMGNVLGNTASITVTANGSAWYVALVTDACGGATIDSVLVSTPTPQVTVPAQLDVACGEQGVLEMNTGGSGDFTYSWSVNGSTVSTSTSITIAPSAQPTWYVATVTDACGNSASDSTLVSSAIVPISVEAGSEVVLACDATGTTISAGTVSGGTGTLMYTWTSNGITLGTSPSLSVPAAAAQYTVTVNDSCGASGSATITVSIQSYPPVVVSTSADVTVTCAGDTGMVTVTGVQGGVGPYTVSWADANGVVISSASELFVNVDATATYTATAIDVCGHEGSAIVSVSILEHPPLGIDLADAMVCENGSTSLDPVGVGGAGGYQFSWPAFPGADSAVTVSPAAPTQYTVNVTDQCGQTASQQVYVGIEHPVVTILANSTGYNEFAFSAVGTPDPVQFSWQFGDGHTSEASDPVHGYADMVPTVAIVNTLTANGCPAMDTIALTPAALLFFPNAFTPDGDGFNETFGPVGLLLDEFEMLLFDRWGAEVAAVSGVGATWDGRLKNGKVAPTGVYVYSFRAAGERLEETKGLGHVTLLGGETAEN